MFLNLFHQETFIHSDSHVFQESGESDQNQPKGESETDSEDFGKEIVSL